MIYEVFSAAKETSNPLAIIKLALIGFFLPIEDVEADGFARPSL